MVNGDRPTMPSRYTLAQPSLWLCADQGATTVEVPLAGPAAFAGRGNVDLVLIGALGILVAVVRDT